MKKFMLNINQEKFVGQSASWLFAFVPLILAFSSKASVLLLSLLCLLLLLKAWIRNAENLQDRIILFFKNNLLFKLVLAFILYASLSTFWSVNAKQGLIILGFEIFLPIFLLTVVMALDDEVMSSLDLNLCAYGFILCALVLVFETRTNMSLRHILGLRQWVGVMSHAGVTLAMLAPVVFVWLSHSSKPTAFAFLAVICLCLFFVINDASKLAMLGFIGAYFLYARWLMSVRFYLFAFLAGYILLQPWIWSLLGADALAQTILGFKASAVHRLHIWETFSRLALLNPWHGYGIASGHVLHNFEEIMTVLPSSLQEFVDVWHPHNNFLEIWLDLGLIGTVLFILFLFQVFKGQWLAVRGHFASVIAILAVGACSHGFWQGWWISAICMVVLLYRIMDAKLKTHFEST
jgi:O-antigen ligase